MVKVVPRTKRENRKVQMGSAILYSGYEVKRIGLLVKNWLILCISSVLSFFLSYTLKIK